MRPRVFIALSIAAIVCATACHAIYGIEDDHFRVRAADAGTDAGPPGECPHETPGTRPEGQDDPSNDRTHVFALRLPADSLSASAARAGFDLDGVCTCDTRDQTGKAIKSCNPPKDSTNAEGCDADGGIDNAVADILQRFGELAGLSKISEETNRTADCGRVVPLVILWGYNGLPDDPRVQVLGLDGTGIREPHANGEVDNGCGASPGDPYPAHWDGTDRWSVRPGKVARAPDGSLLPATATALAWVKGYRLVVDTREGRITAGLPLVLGDKVLNMGTPVFAATLVPIDAKGADLPLGPDGKPSATPAGFRMKDGVSAGRVSTAAILSVVAEVRLGGDAGGPGTFLCSNDFLYSGVKNYVCAAADIMGQPDDDFHDRECDALSLTFQFFGSKVQVGADFVPPASDAGGCGVDWVDTCPKK